MNKHDTRRQADLGYKKLQMLDENRYGSKKPLGSFLDYLNENAFGSINEYIAKLADLWDNMYGEEVDETLDELMEDSDIRDLVNDAYENGDSPSDVLDVIFAEYYEDGDIESEYDEFGDEEDVDDEGVEEGTEEDIEYIDPEENLEQDMEDHIDPAVYDEDVDDSEFDPTIREMEYENESTLSEYEAAYLFEDTLSEAEQAYLFERWENMNPYYAAHAKAIYGRIEDAKTRGKFTRGTAQEKDAITRKYLNDIAWILPHVATPRDTTYFNTAATLINNHRQAAELPTLTVNGGRVGGQNGQAAVEPAIPRPLIVALNANPPTIAVPEGCRGLGAGGARAPRAGRGAAQAAPAPAAHPAAQEPEPLDDEILGPDDFETQVVTRTRPVTRTRTVTRTRPVTRTRTVTRTRPVTRTRTIADETVTGTKFIATVEYDPNDNETRVEAQEVITDIAETLGDRGRINNVRQDAEEGIDVYEICVADQDDVRDIRQALRTSWEDAFAMASFTEEADAEFTLGNGEGRVEEYEDEEEYEAEEEYEDQEEYEEEEEYEDQEEYQEEIRVPRQRPAQQEAPAAPAAPEPTEEERIAAEEPAPEPERPARQQRQPRTDVVRRIRQSGRYRVTYKIADEDDNETDEEDSVVVSAASAEEARNKVEHPANIANAPVFDCHHVIDVEEI